MPNKHYLNDIPVDFANNKSDTGYGLTEAEATRTYTVILHNCYAGRLSIPTNSGSSRYIHSRGNGYLGLIRVKARIHHPPHSKIRRALQWPSETLIHFQTTSSDLGDTVYLSSNLGLF